MIKETFLEIIKDIWPMIVIITVIITSLRIAYLIKTGKKLSLYKDLLYLVFIIYILCLFHVVTFQDVNFGKSNFIPFKEMFRYELFSPKFIRNVMGNVLLFIPFGFFISYILKSRRLWYPVTLTLVVSTTIEIVQYYIGRVFDIDDIILNTSGSIIFYFLFNKSSLSKILDSIFLFKFTKLTFKEYLRGTIELIIIIVLLYYLIHSYWFII